MHPANLDVEVYKGEDFSLSFVFKNPDGTLVDLSACFVEAAFRHEQEKDTKISFTTSIDIPSGTITLFMEKTITNTLRLGTGHYDMVLINALGHSEVLLKGQMVVRYSPTISEAD
jgi:hypothetical protein